MLHKRRDVTAEPTPVSRERAKALLEEIHPWLNSGDRSSLTPGEDNYIRKVWDTLPGTSCWMDALWTIARG